MGKKNYTKFSEHFKKSENEEVINEVNEEIVTEINTEPTEPVVEVTEKPVEETIDKGLVTGVVVGCEQLRVREKPSTTAKVICIINKSDKVQVQLRHEGEPVPADVGFYKVYIASGVAGYCLTKYINIK